MILSSKQALIISANENKEFFMFDPKTTAVLHKYRTQEAIEPHHVYYQHSQQILAQQTGKTFISVWSWDAQEVQLKISLTETMTAFTISEDGHYLFGGSITGNIYLWQLPSGLLLKKKSLHASAIIKILPFRDNHIITVSKTELKIWSLSSLLIEQDSSPALKQYSTILDILSVDHTRNIIAVLTHKSLVLLNGSLSQGHKELQTYQKIDYEFATALALSNNSAYIGDGKGNIDIVQLVASEEEKLELYFKAQNNQLEINRCKKKKVLNACKQPVTSLVFVDTLAYLVVGHSNGEVYIWNNYEIKKSLFLFKTAITGLTLISKPQPQKIFQQTKIKPLNKYELAKEEELLEVLPAKARQEAQGRHFQQQIERNNEEDQILARMLYTLRQPQKLLREQVTALRKQRANLLQANDHYFKMLVP